MLRWRLSRNGLGPLKVGMRVARVARLTGRTMAAGYSEHRSCVQWRLRGAPRGLSIMTAYGRVVRIAAFRGRWRSARGLRIGSSAAAVRRRYGRVSSHRHPYVRSGKYLNVGGPRRRMTFETGAGGRVTSFRGGRTKQVRYIEGCA